MALDADRARAVITKTVAEPLGISLEEALLKMEETYANRMAQTFADLVDAEGKTTVAAFGGGGPMSACSAARIAGVSTVLVPRLAAVFSAYGISFSDIAQSYETDITGMSAADIEHTRASMLADASRDMFQEGHDIADCDLVWNSIQEDGHQILALQAIFRLPHPVLDGSSTAEESPAVQAGTRQVRSSATQIDDVAVYQLSDQVPGASAAGPAIVEGPFFTARVPGGWKLNVTTAGDLLLTDQLNSTATA
jgi:N-methylhydantoinase A/oxoprolinase/acetone carboxylase beta subunit